MGIRGGVAGLHILAPVVVLAASPCVALAQTVQQTVGEPAPLMGALGWLFVLFALAGAAVAIILLRRLQGARADVARITAERDDLQARAAALVIARIRWRTGGALAVDENAARLLNGKPENATALLALLAEPDRGAIAEGLAQLDRGGTVFTGTARCA